MSDILPITTGDPAADLECNLAQALEIQYQDLCYFDSLCRHGLSLLAQPFTFEELPDRELLRGFNQVQSIIRLSLQLGMSLSKYGELLTAARIELLHKFRQPLSDLNLQPPNSWRLTRSSRWVKTAYDKVTSIHAMAFATHFSFTSFIDKFCLERAQPGPVVYQEEVTCTGRKTGRILAMNTPHTSPEADSLVQLRRLLYSRENLTEQHIDQLRKTGPEFRSRFYAGFCEHEFPRFERTDDLYLELTQALQLVPKFRYLASKFTKPKPPPMELMSPCILKVHSDQSGDFVEYEGVRHLTSAEVAEFLRALVAAKGDYIKQTDYTRTRDVNKLPKNIRNLIESEPGKGSRLSADAWIS